uniref:Uncharacterized protein n=1 Tax=viral metagenome TaxID=1070528 RepID=A0A6M3IUZ2_9ZZZZ
MAFDALNFSNIAVGPVKIFSYITGDMIATGPGSYFTSTNAPGLSAGDIIIAQYMSTGTGATALTIFGVKQIDSTGTTCVYILND